jgi:5-hydroxyisourate hydrolase
MSTVSTHVLDTTVGAPAAGVPVTLEGQADEGWVELASAVTNEDGRISDWLEGRTLGGGDYRITFHTRVYFEAVGLRAFYPTVQITFHVHAEGEHYHVPLLLSPFGYSTYRGS